MPSVDRSMKRMVSFRLSDKQYKQFMEICKTTDVRSVSEAARNAMQFWLEHEATKVNGDLQLKLLLLEKQVAQLTAKVQRYVGLPTGDARKE